MKRDTTSLTGAAALASLVTLSGPTHAQGAPYSDEYFAKESENPFSELSSLPLQNNFNFGVGPGRDHQYILNIQPLLSMSLTEHWHLIHRPILPIIAQPELVEGQGGAFGLGNFQYQVYLTPSGASSFVWGIGPAFSFATATNTLLGNQRSSVGPTGAALIREGPWVVGALVNQLWSYSANTDNASVSQMTIQPIINFNFPEGWYLCAVPVMTANWTAASGQKWTIPVGGGIGKVVELGRLPVNLQIQAFWMVEHPDNGPRWSLRPQIQFLFPH